MAFGDGFSAQAYEQSHGRDLYRRGMYTLWKRTVPPASLATFDAPDREKCTARRAHDQHAAAGAGADERPDVRRGRARAGAAHDGRGRQGREEPRWLRVPPRNGARPTGKEIDVLRTLLQGTAGDLPQGSAERR